MSKKNKSEISNHESTSFNTHTGRLTVRSTRLTRDEKGNTSSSSTSSGFNVYGAFKIVAFILLTYGIVSKLLDRETEQFFFESFLDFLTTCPQIDYGWLNFFKVPTDGIPEFLSFIGNSLGSILSVVGFSYTAVINVCLVVVWFFGWLFL